ncbi:MAG: DNA gyrase inhibitor YacG [Sedimentisphaerales bacterium]|nr:DNA gyrase inhibitor YacG [Sedimentisphaerales bacterium]
MSTKQSKCPICGKKLVDSLRQRSECYPFCCKRCQQLDLAKWLDGRYSIPGRQIERDEPEMLDNEQ